MLNVTDNRPQLQHLGKMPARPAFLALLWLIRPLALIFCALTVESPDLLG